MVKKSACNGEDLGSLLESRRAPGVGNDGPFQYFCLENSMDKGPHRPQSMGSKESDTTE